MTRSAEAQLEAAPGVPTAHELSRIAAGAYGSGFSPLELTQRYRPYICPFEVLIDLVPVGSRVLDVGCGGGLFLNLLCARGRLRADDGASVGFDHSPQAVGLARRAAERAGHVGVRFVVAEIANEWPVGAFDVVSVVDVMHHLPPSMWPDVIAQASTRLAPGGVMLYKDMCRRPAWRSLANRAHDLAMARQWIREVPIDDVAQWCLDAGLSIEQRGAAARFWYGHEWIAARQPSGEAALESHPGGGA